MKARLYNKYVSDVVPALKEKHQYSNPHQIPHMVKIVVNMGVSASLEKNAVEDAAKDLGLITGRKPAISKSRHNIANFKLRLGQKIGVMVTLRRSHMYEFVDRLIHFALPRVRDFKGISPKGFDGRGNYTMGVREGIIFPEASFEKVEKPKGMNITFSTTARTDEQGRALLRHLGMPFRS